jgi:hypothetical protein
MLIIVSFISLFALSCKKESTKENPLEDAKDWYLKLTANSKTSFKSSKEKTENVTTEYIWNKAKVYIFSDGKEVVGIPTNVVMSNKYDAPGSYMLLVYKTNNIYNSLIIFNEKNGYLNNTPSTSDVEAAFIVGLKNRELKSLSKSKDVVSKVPKGKTMLVPSEPVCIDWYLTTYTYDSWGNVIEILSEIYLIQPVVMMAAVVVGV